MADQEAAGWAVGLGTAAAALIALWRGLRATLRADAKAETVEDSWRAIVAELREELRRQDERCERALAEQRQRIDALEAQVRELTDERCKLRAEIAALRRPAAVAP